MSILEPASRGAGAVADIWWVMFWGALVVLAIMIVLGLYAASSRPWHAGKGLTAFILVGGIAWPTLTVLALLVYGLWLGEALLPRGDSREPYRIEVVGHQWWWEIRYPQEGGATLIDANEIHVPAGRPVDVHVTSADVIHSFWIPRMGPKIDAVPGYTNVVRIEADEPGTYRGQCSEFCGLQHAGMVLRLVAHEGDGHLDHLERLGGGSAEGADAGAGAGAAAFAENCSACHSLDATQPAADPGPSLAGLSQRAFLGAGAIANGPEGLRTWLSSHQSLKPGNLMPTFHHLEPETIEAIAAFLEERGR
ncbi:cytochrome c oxidase subunit II [Lutibaculum baratangense]|uniref:Cytochrome c oxidase polypeptide II n=1 Tax=Lutibaculum baratangense AMV1 TaxID=631454 RepID=V4RJ10_9HYPH|nr:c-type cytochrome [Lutibaculum baratangense]ESR23260.1 Cytochrome c oxidase polypeptide II [Lutibaculum baratangense AMV1]